MPFGSEWGQGVRKLHIGNAISSRRGGDGGAFGGDVIEVIDVSV